MPFQDFTQQKIDVSTASDIASTPVRVTSVKLDAFSEVPSSLVVTQQKIDIFCQMRKGATMNQSFPAGGAVFD